MKLTAEEKRMLAGKKGQAVKLAMEMIVELGESFGAQELIEIQSCHVQGMYGCLHNAGMEWVEKLAEAGGKVAVPTTVNPSSVCWLEKKSLNIPTSYRKKQDRIAQALMNLGVQPTWTCAPYYVTHYIRKGMNVAWAESNAVSFANTVIGARTNRMGGGMDICAAITGRAPRVGLYLDENRCGTVLVDVAAQNLKEADYNAIGFIIGREVGIEVPVVKGISPQVSNDEIRAICAPAAVSGLVALIHILGVTPEALDREPFEGKKPKFTVTIDRRQIERARKDLSTGAGKNPDIIVLGCPHYSFLQVKKVAELLKGKKVKKEITFWIHTSRETWEMARTTGHKAMIDHAGAKLIPQSCVIIAPFHDRGFKVAMTDSAKYAYYMPSEFDIGIIFGSVEESVQAATS
ncbi:MAG: aconitase X catalytic domain-containing protein [Deltaproteobacteria bacterium]|nr:aconitase X catalytic domain-containing protein [Deltaproteobacteria bacterium]